MVEFEEIEEETMAPSQSDERLLDAEEIEKVAASVSRPTVQMHLTALAKKLRKEGEALKRVEASHATAKTGGAQKQQAPPTQQQQPQEPPPAMDPPRPLPAAATPPPTVSSSVKFTPIDRFSFDAGSYNSQFITLYVPLPGVGSIPKENVVCDFGKDSFNLVVTDLKGKSYRLLKDCLEHDVVPDKCKYIIKADEIRIKLCKIKGEYGSYDYWSKLTDPKKHDKKKVKDDPSSSVMDMMKDMYDSGDDKMRKMIGETMMKQRNGQLDDPMGGGGMGGLGGMADLEMDD